MASLPLKVAVTPRYEQLSRVFNLSVNIGSWHHGGEDSKACANIN